MSSKGSDSRKLNMCKRISGGNIVELMFAITSYVKVVAVYRMAL